MHCHAESETRRHCECCRIQPFLPFRFSPKHKSSHPSPQLGAISISISSRPHPSVRFHSLSAPNTLRSSRRQTDRQMNRFRLTSNSTLGVCKSTPPIHKPICAPMELSKASNSNFAPDCGRSTPAAIFNMEYSP
ncbi:hypothetical protein MPTK1_4g04580 [Marchantia polymorpha subsp. ruderalis]|uniref:Uncharacterized protein n=2 Tax=Marchantia polymorpha TaxID=3197 RepID=A0AAF6B6D0_MARPO|nr:hypothetical protein MARPO_0044s0016 [Marchantia polymorpha]BBN07564.1 hypothetical protein Mp_4g04580 [Marchantia polymorpha subsp. ruderalis]|eukprot:PTQ39536.1 hypothetical protein MARPO_0044s0016 [Marchantia polymorpha]